MKENKKLSAVEIIKQKSDGLRGTLRESLQDEITGAVREDDHALVKFHGMYEQDDRDQREERAQKKLDKLFSFMIRLRIPGGLLKPEQWVAAHHIAGKYSTGVIKITSRQTIQLHGILKGNIKPTLKSFDKAALDSIAACGDVNRNVVCSSHPGESPIHRQVHAWAGKISLALLPKTNAFYEIWLDGEKLTDKATEEDPLYKDSYLPRKFKIAIGIPPNNDADVFANDIGLIAIIENNELKGFNIAAGGGMSSTHGNEATYPRLATVLGFAGDDEKIMKAIYEIITIQRDFGNRADRKLARLKYTIDNMGLESFKAELEKRCGFALEHSRPFKFTERKDRYGWLQDQEGLWHCTLFIENGRVTDDGEVPIKTALLEVAETGKVNFRFTCSQHLILSDIKEADKLAVSTLLDKYGITAHTANSSVLRKNSMACVALPTCPLALTEAQRYLPSLITKIEPLLVKHELTQEEIILRMTGCPNGCARPVIAEIGLVGTAPGRYNLHLAGDRQGERLNKKFKENLAEEDILTTLDFLFGRYRNERLTGETFGDFAERKLF